MSVHGAKSIARRFYRVPKAVREAVRKELERNAEEIVAEMRRLVPEKSGALRASIGWTWGEAPEGSLVVGQVGGRKFGAMRVTIYAGSELTIVTNKRGVRFQNAKLQEFGTVDMAANPFFFPVWRIRRRRTRARISRAMNKAIQETK